MKRTLNFIGGVFHEIILQQLMTLTPVFFLLWPDYKYLKFEVTNQTRAYRNSLSRA